MQNRGIMVISTGSDGGGSESDGIFRRREQKRHRRLLGRHRDPTLGQASRNLCKSRLKQGLCPAFKLKFVSQSSSFSLPRRERRKTAHSFQTVVRKDFHRSDWRGPGRPELPQTSSRTPTTPRPQNQSRSAEVGTKSRFRETTKADCLKEDSRPFLFDGNVGQLDLELD